MIPKNVREEVIVEGLTGEKATFKIKATGKAFRTLIDGLYSNKVRAVIRELCSNAADSHIAAGNEAQFLVKMPTAMDPVFGVRDYGVSMTHEDVMGLYTTIFESTKEGTNEQTGMLGLGSKSPFAYTDSFNVTAWKDGERRTYFAYVESDDIPQINHIGTEPSTEPTGIEVSFSVARDDFSRFAKEMQWVAMGYKYPPMVEGMTLRLPEPRLSGENWAIYPASAFGNDFQGQSFIRQGSAIYPQTNARFPHLGYGWISLVEVPIGTASVTSSRDSLAYDDDTAAAVKKVLAEASADLAEMVNSEILAAKTRIEKAKVFLRLNGILDNIKGSVLVSIAPDKLEMETDGDDGPMPGSILEKADFFGKTSTHSRRQRGRFAQQFEIQTLSQMKILVNDSEVKLVRRAKRIQQSGLGWAVYVLDVDAADRPAAIAWIKECLELPDDRFSLVSALPDRPPAPSIRKPVTKKSVTALKPGQYWMRRTEGKIRSIYGDGNKGETWFPRRLNSAIRTIGWSVPHDEVLFLNDMQVRNFTAKGLLPEALRLDIAVKAEAAKQIKSKPVAAAALHTELNHAIGRYSTARNVLLDNFFPSFKNIDKASDEVGPVLDAAQISLTSLPAYGKIKARVEELAEEFPLMFNKSERSHYEQYVKAVKSVKQAVA